MMTDDRWQVITGDCLEVMPTLDAGSVDAVITDPPYGLNFPYQTYDDTRDNLERLIISFMPAARRVSSFIGVLPGITQISLYPPADWIACVTWNTTGSFGKLGYSQWMPLLVYGRDIPGFGSVNGKILKSDTIRINGGGGVGFQRSEGEKRHTCPKPLNVMVAIIERYTRPGDLILDPFCGSGTTGVACIQTGRRFIGIEIDEGYADIARARIAKAAEQARQEPLPL